MASPASSVAWVEAPQFGKAYHLAKNDMVFSAAKAYCESLGGSLLLAQSKEEEAFLCDTFKIGDCIWLDLERNRDAKNKRGDARKVLYANWKRQEPKERAKNACLVLDANSLNGGLWFSYAAVNYASVICETSLNEGGDEKLAEKEAVIDANLNSKRAKLDEQSNSMEGKVTELGNRMEAIEAKLDRLFALMNELLRGIAVIKQQLTEAADYSQ